MTAAAELSGPVVTFQNWRITNLDPPFPEMMLYVSTRTLSVAQSYHAKRGRLYSDVAVVGALAGELRDGDPAHVKLMPQEDGTIAVSSGRLGWYVIAEPVFAGEENARRIIYAVIFRPEEADFITGSARVVVRFDKLDAKLVGERVPQA